MKKGCGFVYFSLIHIFSSTIIKAVTKKPATSYLPPPSTSKVSKMALVAEKLHA